MSLSTLWNYTPRVFPTLLRGTGFGLCTMVGNAASIFTLVFIIDDSSATIPLGCVGVGCVLASVWVCLLPQVQGRELPETITDTERFKSHSKPVRWTSARPVIDSMDETEIWTIDYE
ncbi:unnamed protein product [Timema podura]|uniref:Uncharacterized protein n=1 Tax=Timema podura TaxID=61482 RepID=A0ABN7PPI0_TIMPD|nr:unnamed protein product [Timema podura]